MYIFMYCRTACRERVLPLLSLSLFLYFLFFTPCSWKMAKQLSLTSFRACGYSSKGYSIFEVLSSRAHAWLTRFTSFSSIIQTGAIQIQSHTASLAQLPALQANPTSYSRTEPNPTQPPSPLCKRANEQHENYHYSFVHIRYSIKKSFTYLDSLFSTSTSRERLTKVIFSSKNLVLSYFAHTLARFQRSNGGPVWRVNISWRQQKNVETKK